MTNSTLAIDTGTPRNVTGHVISGALASGALAGALNYDKFKKEQLSQQEAVQNTIKLSVQGGIATGSAIAAANYIGQGNILGMLSAISIGAMGVYATEKVSEQIEQTLLENQDLRQIEESGE